MKPTTTLKLRQYGRLCSFLFLPFAAQSQNNNDELEMRMNALYKQAHQLHNELPVRDYRGNYFNLTLGTSPYGHIKTWRTEDVCDCEGNVVDTKTVRGNKAPLSLGLGWETRLSSLFSVRLMGSYAHLSHARGRSVMAENGEFSTLLKTYELSQWGLQSAAIMHFNHFYSGVGVSYTASKASGFQTTAQVSGSAPPQYIELKADILTPKQVDFMGNVFVGYQIVVSPMLLASLEMGISRKFYANVQLNFPLSIKTKESISRWHNAYRLSQNVLKQAEAIDRRLHPAKFQTDDCTNSTSTSGNSCPR